MIEQKDLEKLTKPEIVHIAMMLQDRLLRQTRDLKSLATCQDQDLSNLASWVNGQANAVE